MRKFANRLAYQRFLAKLVEARELRGLSQAEVGKAVGLPQSRISDMEHGQRRVDIIELAQLAKLYRKALKWFVPDE